MYDFHNKGCFPAPHSPAISMPEFLQQLYAKINECVKAVNECITKVDTFNNNIVDKWNTVKAECDMVMEQYANTMAGYGHTMDGYTQELFNLNGWVTDLNTTISRLETIVKGYKTEVDQKADEVLSEFEALSEYVVESGVDNGWKWRKFKSGRVEATMIEDIVISESFSYDGEKYYLRDEVTFPLTLVRDTVMMWIQPCTTNMTTAVLSNTESNATFYLQAKGFANAHTCRVYYRLEGMCDEDA